MVENPGEDGLWPYKASMIACEPPNYCKGGGGVQTNTKIKLQWFCSEEQVKAADGMEDPAWMMLGEPGTQFTEYE